METVITVEESSREPTAIPLPPQSSSPPAEQLDFQERPLTPLEDDTRKELGQVDSNVGSASAQNMGLDEVIPEAIAQASSVAADITSMPPPPLPSRFLQQPQQTPVSANRTWKPGHHSSISLSFPFSPLTPLPPTPAVGLKDGLPASSDDEDIVMPENESEASAVGKEGDSATVESSIGPIRSRKSSILPAPRMTRAATLRQQQVEKQRNKASGSISSPVKARASTNNKEGRGLEEDEPEEGEGTASCKPVSSRGRSATKSSIAASTASSRARSISRASDNQGPAQRKRANSVSQSDSPEKQNRPPSLSAFSFTSNFPSATTASSSSAGPASTSATVAALTPGSPRKSFKLTVPSSLGGHSAFNFSPKKTGGETALAVLSRALAKLHAPPPTKPVSRPASSLGSSSDGGSAGQMLPPVSAPDEKTGSNVKGKGKASALAAAKQSFAKPPAFNVPGQAPAYSRKPLVQGSNPFSRPLQKMYQQNPRFKASKATSLETVVGSPVKPGSSSSDMLEDVEGADEIQPSSNESSSNSTNPSASASSSSSDPIVVSDDPPPAGLPDSQETVMDGEKELKRISRLNASRRASMAFSALEQSMREQHKKSIGLGHPTSAANRTPGSDPAVDTSGGRKGKRSTSASGVTTTTTSSGRTVRAPAPFRSFTSANSTSPGSNKLGRTQSNPSIPLSDASGSKRTPGPFDFDFDDRSSDAESATGGTSGRSKRPKKIPGSLSVLEGCTIYVDVHTEDGEDAGGLFLDMLQGLGARILTAGVGQTCTHVVYKNGSASTITKVKLMDQAARPKVVGIGWVVACAEKREKADEKKFEVDYELMNVAGGPKVRSEIYFWRELGN